MLIPGARFAFERAFYNSKSSERLAVTGLSGPRVNGDPDRPDILDGLGY